MDVIPGIIGETELRCFNENTFAALKRVLPGSVATYIKNYTNKPDADSQIVALIEQNIGTELHNLTLHLEMQEKGIPELVLALDPLTFLNTYGDDPEVEEKLLYLSENCDKVMFSITPPNTDDYHAFRAALTDVLMNMQMTGVTPTYPDILQRIDANKFIFYASNGKARSTGVGILNTKHQQWMLCLKGLLYRKYCNSLNIPLEYRRIF